jgi:hypothetical protein
MNLSEAGESRVRGYLFMLESSLRTLLRRDVAADAVREVESHIRERVRETEPMPNERDALNQLLEALGPPHRLARAYSDEIAVVEAVSTGRLGERQQSPIRRPDIPLASPERRRFFPGAFPVQKRHWCFDPNVDSGPTPSQMAVAAG